MLSHVLGSLRRPARGRKLREAREKILSATECCAKGDYAAAAALAKEAIARAPQLAEAHYLVGVLACRTGAIDAGARSIECAMGLEPGDPRYLAALADARLLQQREEEALALYSEAFPREFSAIADLDDAGLPWKRAHPDWTRTLRRVTPALPEPVIGRMRAVGLIRMSVAMPGHLLNWALLLISRRQGRKAIQLLEQAVASDPQLGYAHAALGLLRTLNQDWGAALTAARTARELGFEVFPGANDLCVLSAQLGLGTAINDLDPVFDWSAFSNSGADVAPHLELLPAVEGDAFRSFPPGALVCFIACDTRYLIEHAVALACSIRENAGHCAIHLHLFSPETEAWSSIRALSTAISPMPLSVTWETVDFDRYGGKSVYCAYARFVRLYQLVRSTENRVVMLDADSLVRGDLAAALSGRRPIGLVHAPEEPMWHQYLAGLTVFRKSADSERFLGVLGAFLAANIVAGRGRLYLDQIGLYVCEHHCREALADAIDHLPIERFCDTLFKDAALVWSITQNKADDGPFAQYRQSMLTRYESGL